MCQIQSRRCQTESLVRRVLTMILSSDSQLERRISSTACMVVALLIFHSSMLAWIGLRNSPSLDEVGHLASGLSHWKLGRFDLYRVNPPLVRTLAAVPLLFLDVQTDWTAFDEAPLSRSEFSVGSRFCEINGRRGFFYFTLARWTCVPVSALGGFVTYRWGTSSLRFVGRNTRLGSVVFFTQCAGKCRHDHAGRPSRFAGGAQPRKHCSAVPAWPRPI